MSTNGYSPLPAASRTLTSGVFDVLAGPRAHPQHRYWLHALLFLATLLTTTVVGAGLAYDFRTRGPADFATDLSGYSRLWHDPSYLLGGLPFSITLLAILLAHEMGHYLAARYHAVDVTLPFFLPVPILMGTFGAFIRIRSAILSKRILFDIGIGGPLAGFAVLILPLIIGVSLSRVDPAAGFRGNMIFGTPLLLRFFEWVILGAAPANIALHPVARAAWVGLLATALNLLPIGQLDGGHILYSFVGDRTRILSRIFVACLLALGSIQLFTTAYKAGSTWIFWGVVLFFFGMRHPVIIDRCPLSPARRWLGLVAFVILILSFTPTPIRDGL